MIQGKYYENNQQSDSIAIASLYSLSLSHSYEDVCFVSAHAYSIFVVVILLFLFCS